MISKAKAVKGSVAGIDYIMKEEKQCYELCRNDLIGQNGQEILSEFRELQRMNVNCKNNTFSIVLSPNNDRKYTKDELLQFTEKHLENLGLKDNQYIAYVHQNTKATHVHIIANRIDYDGIATRDNFLAFKAHESADKIAKEFGMKTAKEISREKRQEEKLLKGNKDIKTAIKTAHDLCKVKANNFSEYKELMKSKGIEVKETINNQNKIQGYKVLHKESNLEFRASECKAGVKDLLENNVNMEKGLSAIFKKPAEAQRQSEAQRQVEEQKRVEAQRVKDLETVRRLVTELLETDKIHEAEFQKLAEAEKQAEAQRQAEARKKAEEQRLTEQQKFEEAQRQAEARKKAEEQKQVHKKKKGFRL